MTEEGGFMSGSSSSLMRQKTPTPEGTHHHGGREHLTQQRTSTSCVDRAGLFQLHRKKKEAAKETKPANSLPILVCILYWYMCELPLYECFVCTKYYCHEGTGEAREDLVHTTPPQSMKASHLSATRMNHVPGRLKPRKYIKNRP